MSEFLVYRVVAVADATSDDTDDTTILLTSYTYCSPNTIFWLSDDGLEDPNCTCIILTILEAIGRDRTSAGFGDLYRVEFEYDGGKYVGTLIEHSGQKFTASIRDISSL